MKFNVVDAGFVSVREGVDSQSIIPKVEIILMSDNFDVLIVAYYRTIAGGIVVYSRRLET